LEGVYGVQNGGPVLQIGGQIEVPYSRPGRGMNPCNINGIARICNFLWDVNRGTGARAVLSFWFRLALLGHVARLPKRQYAGAHLLYIAVQHI
jgi:hypothetical protein